MSILIRGMEMPTKKNGAVLIVYPDGRCAFENGEEYKAVPIQPHGRLIDADALRDIPVPVNGYFDKELNCFCYQPPTWVQALETVKAAPTIIPAEEGNE